MGAVGIVGVCFNWCIGNFVCFRDEELKGFVCVDYFGNGYMVMYFVGMIWDIGFFQRELFFGYIEVEFGLCMCCAGYQVLVNGDFWKQCRVWRNKIGF